MQSAVRRVVGRRVWDSRGRPTVEAEVHLAGGACGRAIAPAGASTGRGEAVDLRDGGGRLGGLDVRGAVANVNGPIARALAGFDAADQAGLDAALIALDATADKHRLGANATVAVSMAAARAAAAACGEPLWRYLGGGAGGGEAIALPLPEIQIFGGGAHAAGRVDVQDFMVVPLAAASFEQAIEHAAEIYRAAGALLEARGRLRGVADEGGYWPEFASNEEALEALVRAIEEAGFSPGDEIGIALDVAASQLARGGRYRLGLEGRELDSDALCALLCTWAERFPIVSLEDPLGEDDTEGLRRLVRALGARIQIVGDDVLVTSAERVRRARGACNAILVKPNQAGTLSEARAAVEAARALGWGAIASARSGESEDVFITHLAVGWGLGQLKVGAFARSERMAKWNEGLRIEEMLGARARFAGRGALSARSALDRAGGATRARSAPRARR